MVLPEANESSGKKEIEAVSDMDAIREAVKREILSRKRERKTRKARDALWESISPEMMPIPGTPDFCEFLMDGAV